MEMILDLLGDPVPENHGGPGRPAHVPTARNRNKVMILLGLGWSNGRIAGALDITVPTLRKHYFSELSVRAKARDRLTATLAMHLMEQVTQGSVPAVKAMVGLIDRNDRMNADRSLDERASRQTGRRKVTDTKLGKKAQARADAQTPGTDTAMGLLLSRAGADRPMTH